MSDEMVQEKTGKGNDATAGSLNGGQPTASASPDSSPVGADFAATEEPAPAHPVTETTVTATPAPTAAPPAEESAPAAESGEDAFEVAMRAMSSDKDSTRKPLQEGDVIVGTVMRVDKEGVLVDVGAKSEGIIRPNELSRDPGIAPETLVQVGEKINVFVMEPENQEGNPILSKKRADFEDAWVKVQKAKESGETLMALVQDRVKGGLVVDLGIRGFVPASHVGNGSLKNNLDRFLGQTIPLKVIEVDKERRKVVLSNKMAMMEEREAKSAETKANLAPNQIRHGMVRRLTAYGAFIDLGGIDGLLHISEMSWTRINDPKEVLREGQEVDVIVLKMDLENNRVSLGMRQILPDPWTEIAGKYKEGDTITGTVTRLVPFGAFVQVEGGVEGIIPNVELPRNRGGKGNAGIAVGEEVEVKVLGVNPDARKMTLSMRALQPVEEREAPAPRDAAAPTGGPPRESTGTGGGGGGKRGRGGERGRDEERDDYTRYAPGRNDEPRFNQLGEAFAKARGNRRDRRPNPEEIEEEDLNAMEIEDEPMGATDEPTAETGSLTEAALEPTPAPETLEAPIAETETAGEVALAPTETNP